MLKSIAKKIYQHCGYDVWQYKNHDIVVTETFAILGKKFQKIIHGEESRYFILMSNDYRVHKNVE